MDNSDITTQYGTGSFNYRVGAIIINSNKILMATNCGSKHYYTVGGRVKLGESAHDAVLREVREEIKLPLTIDRLAFIHENFFTWESTPCHEIALFFLMKPNPLLNEAVFDMVKENYGNVSFHWLPINELDKHTVYPKFLRSELINLTDNVLHLVTRNDITKCVSG